MAKTRKARIAYRPHAIQKAFHDAVAERTPDGKRKYKYFALLWGRRCGKDRGSINEYIKSFVELDNRPPDPTRVPHTHGWIVAPTFPLAQQSWRELKAFFPEHLVKRIDNNALQLETNRGGIIEVKSAHKPDDLVSVGLDILLVTEAARVAELAWQNMAPMLNSPGREGLCILNSTPKGMNWFGRSFWYGQEFLADGTPNPNRVPSWWSSHAPTLANTYLSDEQREEIENFRLTMPEDIYAQEYEAKILDNGSTVFRGVAKVIGGMLREAPLPGRRYVMGVDLGKLRDFTVITVMDVGTREVVGWKRINQLDWNVILDTVVMEARRWRAYKVLVDQTGIGEPITDMLKKRIGRGTVEGYTSGSNKQKVDLVQPLQVAIEQGNIRIPNIKTLVHELNIYEYQITGNGAWTMNAPPGEHDDAVLSLALCLRAASEKSVKIKQGYREIYGRA